MGRVAVGLLLLVAACGVLLPARFASVTDAVLAQTLSSFGWFYLLVVSGMLLFMLHLAFGRHGSTRLGGPDAVPDFSARSWFAMLFSAGMGIGLVFFGASEPLSHYLSPPEGLTGQTPEAARAAMRYAFFHSGLHPWGVYGLVGLAMAHARYNRGGSGSMSDLLTPLLGARTRGRLGQAVDLLAILATVGGVATTLGYGAVQIASGLSTMTGWPPGIATQIVVIVVATVLFMLSAASGLHKGVKYLSNANVVLMLALLVVVLALGPTKFILEIFTSTTGGYVNQLPSMSLRLSPFSLGTWAAKWTIFYWAWWISWAPFVGTFIARISRGRTIREFVMGVLLAPALLGVIWYSTFGGTALHQQMFEGRDLAAVSAQGSEGVLFAVFAGLPLSTVLSIVALILLMTFFVTSADSATLVLSSMAQPDREPSFRSKLVWGLIQPGIAVALLLSGGLGGLRAAAVVTALPLCFILVAVAWSLVRRLASDESKARAAEIARRRRLDALLEAQPEEKAAAE
jgi:glycine betaine transporter